MRVKGTKGGREAEAQPRRVLVAAVVLAWWSVVEVGGAEGFTLETGQGVALQRIEVPVVIPTNYPTVGLRLDVSFGTDEQVVAGEFLDSLTVTLRTTNRSHSVTVLTADRFGVTLAPESPLGLLDPLKDFLIGPADPDPGNTLFAFQSHQRTLVQIPAAFLTEPSVLVLSLFDNEDSEVTRAVIARLRVRPGAAQLLTLESSASPAGPYAVEAAEFDRLAQSVTLPRAGRQRFYRLRGETPSSVTRLRRVNSDVVVEYEKDLGQPVLRLEGADLPGGPYATVNNAVIDLAARRIVVPLLNAPGFFRMGGSHPARIVNDVVSGEFRRLEFEVTPVPPQLESSAAAMGPFAAETGVRTDPFGRTLVLPGGGVARFYRIASDLPWIIQGTSAVGDDLVLQYEDP